MSRDDFFGTDAEVTDKNVKERNHNEAFMEKSITWFFAPFHFEGAFPEVCMDGWRLRAKPFNKENDVLFPHIMGVLRGQTIEDLATSSQLTIYQLDTQRGGKDYSSTWRLFAKKCHTASIANYGEVRFHFFDDNTVLSPHIYIAGRAGVGMLVFGMRVEGSTDDLIQLNYVLHKIDGSYKGCHCPVSEYDGTLRRLLVGTDVDSFGAATSMVWNMAGVVRYLLTDVFDVVLFSNTRLHLFTCNVVDGCAGGWAQSEILDPLIHLSHCQKDSYMLPVNDAMTDGTVLRLFDNIYVSSSVEACSIVAVARKENASFMADYDKTAVANRYIWIYFMALLQRYAMLNLARQLVDVEASGDEDGLWRLMTVYRYVKTTFQHVDLTPYSQHSLFYLHCCRGLRVTENFSDFDSKTSSIRLVDEHNLQQVLRRRDDDDRLRDENLRRRDSMLGLMVALLTVAQVAGVAYSMLENTGHRWIWTSVVSAVCVVAIVVVWVAGRHAKH